MSSTTFESVDLESAFLTSPSNIFYLYRKNYRGGLVDLVDNILGLEPHVPGLTSSFGAAYFYFTIAECDVAKGASR